MKSLTSPRRDGGPAFRLRPYEYATSIGGLIVLAALVLFAPSNPTAASNLQLTQPDWIPFDFHDDRYIFVRGTINGHETDIIVDTGAEISFINQSFAASIGVRQDEDTSVLGVGGRTKAYMARDIEIASGSLSVRDTTVAIVDLSAFEPVIGRPMPFILGTTAFEHTVVDIDYPNRRVAFWAAEGFEYDGPGNTADVKRLGSGRLAIEASIEGGESGWYLIDTGSAGTVDVFPSFATRQSLLDDRTPSSEWVGGGVGGLLREATISLESYSFGGFELKDLPASVPLDNVGPLTREDFDGLVGSGVLSRFRIILDYARSRVHMQPAPGWQSLEFRRNLVGLALLPEGDRLRVVFVAPGSPAQHAGWKQDMFVTAVDGKVGTGIELRATFLERSHADPGSRITLLDGDGNERPVVLRRFY